MEGSLKLFFQTTFEKQFTVGLLMWQNEEFVTIQDWFNRRKNYEYACCEHIYAKKKHRFQVCKLVVKNELLKILKKLILTDICQRWNTKGCEIGKENVILNSASNELNF